MFIKLYFFKINMFLKKIGKDFEINFYRYKLYDKKRDIYLLTLDDGSFIFLNKENFEIFKSKEIKDENLFDILEEKGFIITKKKIFFSRLRNFTPYSYSNFKM